MRKILRNLLLLVMVVLIVYAFYTNQKQSGVNVIVVREVDPVVLIVTPTSLPQIVQPTPTPTPYYDLSQFLTPESQCGVTMSCLDVTAGVCDVNMSCTPPDTTNPGFSQILRDSTKSFWQGITGQK